MKSIRLSKQLREEIVENISKAYDKTTPPPFESMMEIEKDFAENIYNRIMKPYQDKIGNIPVKFLNTANSFYAEIGGQRKCLSFGRDNEGNSIEKVFFANTWQTAIIIETSDPIVEAKEEAVDKYEAWQDKKQAMLAEARAIINQVNTTKQLVETWEEVEPMIPEYIRNPSKGIQLPAILNDTLNASIGLNKGDK